MAREHKLKCWSQYWDALEAGEKNFEVRRDDRGFQKGDFLILQKYDNERGDYVRHYSDNKPHETRRKIKYILTGGQLGIEPGYVVLALSK